MGVDLRRTSRLAVGCAAVAMFFPSLFLAAPDAASPAPQASPTAPSEAARIVDGLRIIGRVRARTSFCSALVHGGAPATAGALGYEVALGRTIADLQHVSLKNPLTKAQSLRPLEDDLRALALLAQAGRPELHGLGAVADRSQPDLRRAVLGYRDALDGAKARQYFLAKQIAGTVGELEEMPADSFIAGTNDPNILLNEKLPPNPGADATRSPLNYYSTAFYDDLAFADVTPQTAPALNEALTVDDHIRSDLKTAADHAAQAVALGNC